MQWCHKYAYTTKSAACDVKLFNALIIDLTSMLVTRWRLCASLIFVGYTRTEHTKLLHAQAEQSRLCIGQ